ncbi:MAG: cytidine deaminase [Caldilineaceae bacterium]|nr:cytidine deaminase [Caldilineaceae bacterium]
MHVTTPEELMAAAKAAAANAYIPYSGFRVGAAVLDADGSVTVGCNVENAGYGSTICAERTALVSAVAQGRKQPTALAVYTEPGVSPCGSCRQVMVELGPTMQVFLGNAEGRLVKTSIAELLPNAFINFDRE